MSSPEGKVVIASGWRKSGILDAVEMGLSKLPVLDPFNDICPLVDASIPKETLSLASLCPQELESYRTKITDEIDDDDRNGKLMMKQKILATHLIYMEMNEQRQIIMLFTFFSFLLNCFYIIKKVFLIVYRLISNLILSLNNWP